MHGSIWTKNELCGRQRAGIIITELNLLKIVSVQSHLPPSVKDSLLSLSLQIKQ